MPIKSFNVLGLLAALALVLAACGTPPTQAFPGLATDGEWIFLAQGQHVRAVNPAAGGQQQWMFPNPANNNKYGVFVSTPAVDGDLVVVGSEGPAGSYSGALFGLDRNTGQQRWCLVFDQKAASRLSDLNCVRARVPESRNLFGIGGAVDNRVIGGLTLFDGRVYFGLGNGSTYSVDAATGQDQWLFKADRDVWAAPLATEDRVYVSSLDHHIYALDRETGRELWRRDLGAAVAGTATLLEDTLYVGTFGSAMHALDADSGEDLWPQPFETSNWVWDGPSLQDETLYITDVSGVLYAVSAADGRQIWSQKPGGAMRARPAVTEARLFAGDRSGNLFGLDGGSGTPAWTKTLKGQILVTPLVVGNAVIVAPFGATNLLEAYTLNGDFSWAFAPSN